MVNFEKFYPSNPSNYRKREDKMSYDNKLWEDKWNIASSSLNQDDIKNLLRTYSYDRRWEERLFDSVDRLDEQGRKKFYLTIIKILDGEKNRGLDSLGVLSKNNIFMAKLYSRVGEEGKAKDHLKLYRESILNSAESIAKKIKERGLFNVVTGEPNFSIYDICSCAENYEEAEIFEQAIKYYQIAENFILHEQERGVVLTNDNVELLSKIRQKQKIEQLEKV
ncbi:MAG TPA: hypothetical protein PLE07_01865 [Candidatus Paceibacterota bacterium]|nr:hypothetical protein [Candidatus Paceibacterota bacterium]